MAPDPYKYFRLEARELLDQCSDGVLALEKGAGGETVQRLLRLAHTLKGAARVVKQVEIADCAHAIEDTLTPFRDTTLPVGRGAIDAILSQLDKAGRHLKALSPGEAPATPAAGRPAEVAAEPPRVIRADILEMDAVLDGVAETHALLAGMRHAALGLEQAQRLADVLLAQLGAQRHRGLETNGLHALAEDLTRRLNTVERGLGTTLDQMDRELHQLRDSAERLRLVPADTIFTSLERTAFDAARDLGKEVALYTAGGEIRLDSHVLATMQGALIQLIRNAVAHGIEPPSARRGAGKHATGRIAVAIARTGRRILFSCADDGGGLDLDAIRRTGRGAESLDDAALIRRLLKGGISTSAEVTEMAGRGIGLDIVREAVERLGGSIRVETERGRSTRFALEVPASLTAVDALMMTAGDDGVLALPLDAVRATARIAAEEILPAAPGLAVLHDGAAIAFLPLAAVLEGGRPAARRHWSLVVLAGAGGLAAIGVDRLLGIAKLVVRPLPGELPASPAIAGVALDAEGNPQLVLDPDGVVASVRSGAAAVPEPAQEQRPILVIDDSLTTRMLEQSILEGAGYEVDLALSAEEGLEAARRRRYALFLVDVEMPGMNGFGFVERVRADPALHGIPAILVTSRAAPEDLERGRAVGAEGYMVKSEFDQAKLLALIRSLVE